jgi:polyphosphate kinase
MLAVLAEFGIEQIEVSDGALLLAGRDVALFAEGTTSNGSGVLLFRSGLLQAAENIRVCSIIGRFLEHSRIFYFLNDAEENVYLSSADWMGRNFFGRIELCFPVLDRKVKRRVIQEGLKPYLADNSQAWVMDADGDYRRRKSRGRIPRSAQEQLLALLAVAK